jgi:hypothetical protein
LLIGGRPFSLCDGERQLLGVRESRLLGRRIHLRPNDRHAAVPQRHLGGGDISPRFETGQRHGTVLGADARPSADGGRSRQLRIGHQPYARSRNGHLVSSARVQQRRLRSPELYADPRSLSDDVGHQGHADRGRRESRARRQRGDQRDDRSEGHYDRAQRRRLRDLHQRIRDDLSGGRLNAAASLVSGTSAGFLAAPRGLPRFCSRLPSAAAPVLSATALARASRTTARGHWRFTAATSTAACRFRCALSHQPTPQSSRGGQTALEACAAIAMGHGNVATLPRDPRRQFHRAPLKKRSLQGHRCDPPLSAVTRSCAIHMHRSSSG